MFGAAVAQGVRVQYGGSVTAANAASSWAARKSMAALVGGASLKVADFAGIIKATALVK